MFAGVYDPGQAPSNGSAAVETSSGSITAPADGSVHDLFVDVAGDTVRFATATSGAGGMRVDAGQFGVFVGRFLGNGGALSMRSDTTSATVKYTWRRVVT